MYNIMVIEWMVSLFPFYYAFNVNRNTKAPTNELSMTQKFNGYQNPKVLITVRDATFPHRYMGQPILTSCSCLLYKKLRNIDWLFETK